jgi:hypothetical protein
MNTHSAAIDKRGPFSRNSAVVQIRAISWLQLAGYLQSYVRRRSFIALVDYHVMNMSHSTKVTFNAWESIRTQALTAARYYSGGQGFSLSSAAGSSTTVMTTGICPESAHPIYAF